MSLRRLIFPGGAVDAEPVAPPQAGARGPRLLGLAEPVLLLANRLRATTAVQDLARLRERIADVLLDFQARAHSAGVEGPRLAQATEVLGALIDHVITTMPWGGETLWQPLSSLAPAGTRTPAQRLLDIARATSPDTGMEELIGVAVSLGFERRGRAAEDPHVEQLSALLAAPDQKAGLHAAQGLSPEGRSPVPPSAGTSWLPLWVSSLLVAALLAGLYFALQVSLGIQSDRVYARLASMNVPQPAANRPLAASPRLAPALAEQIAAHEVWVRDEVDRSVVRVPGSRLFAVGTATLQPAGAELLRPIALALHPIAGRIRVIGHTDGAVARSARYPSDWELSLDRARVVQEALRGLGLEAARLTYDGRANIEPLAAAERTELTGADGRIEIVLLVGR